MTIFAGIALSLYWCLLGFMWWRVIRHYRHNTAPAVAAIMRALWRSREKRHRCQRIIAFYGLIIFLGISGVFLKIALPWLIVPVVVTAAGTSIHFLLIPPIALVLSSSDASRAKLASQLQQSCAGFRVLFFLNTPSRGSTQAANLIQAQGATGGSLWLSFLDGNHWIDRGEWKDIVFEMMRLVPILIVDLRSSSSSLDEEIQHIRETHLLTENVIFISDGISSLKTLRDSQRSSSRITAVNEAELGREIFWRIRRSERKPRIERHSAGKPTASPERSHRRTGTWIAIIISSFVAMAIVSALYLYNNETSISRSPGVANKSLNPAGFTVTEILFLSLMLFLAGVIVIAIAYGVARWNGHRSEEMFKQARSMESLGPLEQYSIFSSDPGFRPVIIGFVGVMFCITGVLCALWAVLKCFL